MKLIYYSGYCSKPTSSSSRIKYVNVRAIVTFSFILLSVGDISNTFRNVYVGTTQFVQYVCTKNTEKIAPNQISATFKQVTQEEGRKEKSNTKLQVRSY